MPASECTRLALQYQNQILPAVSRTFALTIPQLPGDLSEVVGNAYLLCRIADTIEDEAGLSERYKQRFHHDFIAVVEGRQDPRALIRSLDSKLGNSATEPEKDLVQHLDRVVTVTHRFSPRQRAAMENCVRIMCMGMPEFQNRGIKNGLSNMAEMNRYCYHVAGVVGEMLTELFCAHAGDIDQQQSKLMRLAPSFGQGLQMTNILKDIWADAARGMCWLPAEVFARAGYDLRQIKQHRRNDAFVTGVRQLVRIANLHLDNALEYTLAIPARHVGIRRFCLWAVGLAVLTLRKIDRNPGYSDGSQVKVSRKTVSRVVGLTSALTHRDGVLKLLHRLYSRRLRLKPGEATEWIPDYQTISQWTQPPAAAVKVAQQAS